MIKDQQVAVFNQRVGLFKQIDVVLHKFCSFSNREKLKTLLKKGAILYLLITEISTLPLIPQSVTGSNGMKYP